VPVEVPSVILEVRRIMQDKGAGRDQRSSDYEIRGALNLTLADIRRARPDFFIGSLGTSQLPDARDVDTLDIDEYMFTPISLVTAGYMLLEVDEYTDDGTAANILALGRQQIGGTP